MCDKISFVSCMDIKKSYYNIELKINKIIRFNIYYNIFWNGVNNV